MRSASFLMALASGLTRPCLFQARLWPPQASMLGTGVEVLSESLSIVVQVYCHETALFGGTVEVLGDDLIARLEGPSGDVQMGGVNDTILFSAHDSEDPSDPFDRLEPMR
eukprot:scaffold230868_cov16-Tisochrysis_lutea.AAC.1